MSNQPCECCKELRKDLVEVFRALAKSLDVEAITAEQGGRTKTALNDMRRLMLSAAIRFSLGVRE
jgi:hypothetical protein